MESNISVLSLFLLYGSSWREVNLFDEPDTFATIIHIDDHRGAGFHIQPAMQFDLLQEVFYQTGIGGIIYSKYFTRAWCRVILKQTVEKARKLGLLRKQKFRSRTRAIEVAGT